MLKNKLTFLLVYLVNMIVVLILIAFVVESTLLKILLGIYLIAFSTVVSFISRDKSR